MPHCPPGKHVVDRGEDGVLRCLNPGCEHEPCEEDDHDWSVHPHHIQHYPPVWAMVCRGEKCKEHRLWPPPEVLALMPKLEDPGTIEHDYHEHAKASGHSLHKPLPVPAELREFNAMLDEHLKKGGGT